MKWASALSRNTSLEDALSECASKLRDGLGPGEVSIAFAFATPHFAAHYGRMGGLVSDYLSPEVFLGCSGGGVIGAGREVEHRPAVSLVAARLPGVEVTPFRIGASLPDLDGPPDAWERLIGAPTDETAGLILLADPFSARAGTILSGLDYAYPGSPKVGGLASGGTSPGTNSLFSDGEVFPDGVVGAALSGDVVMETVVAQGCRPVGETMSVTGCDGNFLYELDGRPAFEAINEMFSRLDERDRNLARSTLFAGVLMDEFAEEPAAGEFLIRNVIGVDPARGALAIGEHLYEGMRLRFHVRDAETSAEDLRHLLEGHANRPGQTSGALLFSCLGRGENLYGQPDFDSTLFHDHIGNVPVGGFFCNGEIGPVGPSTFLHGYTSSFALFKPCR